MPDSNDDGIDDENSLLWFLADDDTWILWYDIHKIFCLLSCLITAVVLLMLTFLKIKTTFHIPQGHCENVVKLSQRALKSREDSMCN